MSINMNLSNEVKIATALATTAANTTTVTGTEVDMAGYEGVLFICKFGTAAANNQLHCEQDTATGMASATDLEGTDSGVGSSDEIVWIDLYKPQEQFVRVMADRGTSTTIDWAISLKYGASKVPVDNTTSGTIFGELHESPDEGTK